VYVQLEVGRGLGAQDLTEGHLLIGGYPGSFAALGYPQTQPLPPSSGAGVTRSVTIANPAAGSDWSIVLPTGVLWILNSVSATLVTSATVGNRTPALVVTDNTGHIVYNGAAAYAQAASLTWTYSWSGGGIAPPAGTTQNGGSIPAGLRVPAGWTIMTATPNRQAGDQWQNIVLGVQELVAG